MRLVERHIIKDGRFNDLCHRSGLLYNYTTYHLRQSVINKTDFPSEYELSTRMSKENQYDYRSLPAQTSQQVIGLVFKNFKSWFKTLKEYSKNPSKFTSKPRMPGYKKGKKMNIVIFTGQQVSVKDGFVRFPKKENIKPIKTNIGGKRLCQVRIVPNATCYAVEVIYEDNEVDLGLDKSNFISIDLGLSNYVSAISNVVDAFIINGRIIKSFNRFFNKSKAIFQGFVGDKGKSKRLSRLNNYRNSWIEDKNHKVSRFIINKCIENNVGTIIIGLNKGWKNKINIGKVNNQQFIQIPHSKLIQKIQYKAKMVGIDVIITEESYTSKVDHLAKERLGKNDYYLGKRVKRGLFRSSTGVLINADINGAIGIARKVIGDSFLGKITDIGLVFNPVKLNVV